MGLLLQFFFQTAALPSFFAISSLVNLYGHSVQVFEHFETCTDTVRSVRSGGYAHACCYVVIIQLPTPPAPPSLSDCWVEGEGRGARWGGVSGSSAAACFSRWRLSVCPWVLVAAGSGQWSRTRRYSGPPTGTR